MADPQKVEEKATEAIDKVGEAAKGATDEQKEEVKERVGEVASFFSHGLSKAGELVHVAKDFVDGKGMKMASGELPVSDKDVGESSLAAKSSDATAAENQPFVGASWKNCFGLCKCLNGTSE